MKKIPHFELFLAPLAVLVFAGLLSLMYGWVGTINSLGFERSEGLIPATGAAGSPGTVQGGGFWVNTTRSRAYLGAAVSDPGPQNPPGAVVIRVMPGSPAASAGISSGDILVRCGFKPVDSVAGLDRILAQHRPGDVIKCVKVCPGRATRSFHVRLAESPAGGQGSGAGGAGTGGHLVAASTQPGRWLGITVQDPDAVMARQMDLPKAGGIIVADLDQASPAARSGIRIGDLIQRVNGRRISTVARFKDRVDRYNPGDGFKVTALRDGKQITFDIVPGQRPKGTQHYSVIPKPDVSVEGAWIGMEISELDPGRAEDHGLPRGTRGILVNDVEGPPANGLGFEAGDCITAVNSTPTPSLDSFVSATRHQRGAVVDIYRGERHFFITVPPPGMDRQENPRVRSTSGTLVRVAAQTPAPAVGVLTDGNSLYSSISSAGRAGYILFFDSAGRQYTGSAIGPANSISGLMAAHGATVLIAADLGHRTHNTLTAKGVEIYTGVQGTALDGYQLYKSGSLLAAAP